MILLNSLKKLYSYNALYYCKLIVKQLSDFVIVFTNYSFQTNLSSLSLQNGIQVNHCPDFLTELCILFYPFQCNHSTANQHTTTEFSLNTKKEAMNLIKSVLNTYLYPSFGEDGFKVRQTWWIYEDISMTDDLKIPKRQQFVMISLLLY